MRLGTGVTCPIMRIHPAVLAQTSATAAAMMPGRFFFGVGTGENLNEHILGEHWPPAGVRLEMLQETLEIWPTAALEGEMTQELPLPEHFEQAAQMVNEGMITKMIVCGPDAKAYR